MDTSTEYIQMCWKAEEIQALRKSVFENGDWFYSRADNEAKPVVTSWWYHSPSPVTELFGGEKEMFYCDIWLPRIDQFIEILRDESTFNDWFHSYIIFRFSEMAPLPQWSSDDGRNIKFDSMEQLLLAYVMWEKHEKRWDGIDWIAK